MHASRVIRRASMILCAAVLLACASLTESTGSGPASPLPHSPALPVTRVALIPEQARQAPPQSLHNMRGGWNFTSPAEISSAAALGINTALLYGPPPLPSSPLGRALAHSHIRVISAELSELVAYYECTRVHTVTPRPPGTGPYCGNDPHYSLERLYSEMAATVKRNATNPLITGYWILDDTPDWDFGSLRPVLVQARELIPKTLPTICGFSAGIQVGGKGDWVPGRAANFTPAGCDAVAPYIYTSPTAAEDPPDDPDWAMTLVLPSVEDSLMHYGWQPDKQALIGVGQAWGGTKIEDGGVIYPPTSAAMQTQAAAYCAAGASGIAFYAWNLDAYTNLRTPGNDPSLSSGVRAAIATCPP